MVYSDAALCILAAIFGLESLKQHWRKLTAAMFSGLFASVFIVLGDFLPALPPTLLAFWVWTANPSSWLCIIFALGFLETQMECNEILVNFSWLYGMAGL